MTKLVKHTLIGLGLSLFSFSAFAAEYQIDVTGTLNLDPGVTTLFGNTAATPVHMTIDMDTSLAAVTVVPANTPIDNGGGTIFQFTTDVTFVPVAAIKSLGIAIGTGSWTTTSLLSSTLGTNVYGLMLAGDLTDGAVTTVSVFVNNSNGYLSLGEFSCPSTCQLNGSGVASSTAEGTTGTFSGLSATVTAINAPTPAVELANLQTAIDNMTVKPGAERVFDADIKAAQMALKNGKTDRLKTALNRLIKIATALSGKALSATDSASIVTEAQTILSQFP